MRAIRFKAIDTRAVDSKGIRYEFTGIGNYTHDDDVFETKEELLKNL